MVSKNRIGIIVWTLVIIVATVSRLSAIEYPSKVKPDFAEASSQNGIVQLENRLLQLQFRIANNQLRFGQVKDKQTDQTIGDEQTEFFLITLDSGKVIPCSQMKLAGDCRVQPLIINNDTSRQADRFGGKQIVAQLISKDNTVRVRWTLELRDSSNYIRQFVRVEPVDKEVTVRSVRFLSLPADDAEVSGVVSGSPIVFGNMFFAYEHPIAANKIFDPARYANLALEKPVTASGVWGSLVPELAVDGEEPGSNSYWGCANLPVWLMVDLKKQAAINKIRLVTYYNNNRYYGYQIESSNDKKTWKRIVDANGNKEAATAQGYVHKINPVQARYLKVTITNNSEGNHFGGHIVELEAFSPDTPKLKTAPKRMSCFMDRNTTLAAGQSLEQSSVIGVVPEGQLRRGYLYYLERERAQPYRQYLHYNSWYHLNIHRQVENRMREPECIETIDHVGRELVQKRGVELEGFVWDDGWDNFNSLWGFHDGFPNGFTKMTQAAKKFNSKTGVWLSPFGGYGNSKKIRLDYGRKHGYEINKSGFSLAGPVYYKCFRDRCVQVMQDYGVDFFKFDGVGGGSGSGGLKSKDNPVNDVDAMLKLIAELRQEDPSVYISATTGTWASPYFLFHADNIWRQGGDTGFHGKGPRREQWITYRDMFVYSHIVKGCSLYPLNALMPHGLVVGDQWHPKEMELQEKLINNEVWMMFACGTNLLELYITPELLKEKDWDVIARAAKWARANKDVLVDTHWIGGNPAKAEVYGYASWAARKGAMVLRNPNEKQQAIQLDIASVFDLPAKAPRNYELTSPQLSNQGNKPIKVQTGKSHTFTLKPFEVLVLDAMP
jgi:hypothetical protein